MVLAQQVDPDVVRRVTQEVLAQADYRDAGGSSLLDRGVGYVLEALGRLLLRFGDGGGTGSIVASVVLVLVLLLLIVAVVLFLRRLRGEAAGGRVVTGPVGRDPIQWSQEADDHEAAGELRQALRCRYRETLSRLAAANMIEEIPGRTTQEYLVSVTGSLPAAAEDFATMTFIFEQVWYGGQVVDTSTLQQVKDLRDGVLTAVPGNRRMTSV